MKVTMEGRHRKVQVVLAAIAPSGEWSFLIFKTNKDRGQFWQNVTGSVEEGETFEEAALREAKEESALNIESIIELQDLGLTTTFQDRWKRKVEEHSYLIVCEEQWKPTIDPSEHEDWKWILISSLKSDCVEWPSNYDAIERAAKLVRRMGA
ncbi:MAG: NUDIX domain-containing protein [Bacteriovoracaceae bacterium]|nr:NUDIX domain-containing protein [Bacteriovoracaceae bacterium]